MQSADPTGLHRARELTRHAAQWLQLLGFRSRPGAPTFSKGMCHYHHMLDPEASDADRLAACRAMGPAVQRRRLAEEFVAEAEQAHKMQLDPYHLHWKTTPRGAALWAIANLLGEAIAAFEAEQVDA
jgi:hypothetical protein